MRIKTVSIFALLLAVAQVLGYFEQLIPMFHVVPGGKIGLANVVTMVVFCTYGAPYALCFGLLRCLLASLFYSGFSALFYSGAGTVLSVLLMWAVQKTAKTAVSEIGLSVIGAAGFNVGQIFACVLVLGSVQVVRYLPVLLVISAISGFITGLISQKINGYLQKSHQIKNGEYKSWK